MKNTLKKTIIIVILFCLCLFFYKESDSISYNHDSINYIQRWQPGDEMPHPILSFEYESQYIFFSDLIEEYTIINNEKIYVIENAFDLYMLSKLSSEEAYEGLLDLHYVLGNDIDYYQIVLKNPDYKFRPIGFKKPFNGTFDGQGFSISNLYFESILTEEFYASRYDGLKYYAMFSKTSVDALITRLGLINPIIIMPIQVGLISHVSPLVGFNEGVISHVYIQDTRTRNSGYMVEGDVDLSGLVSINKGMIEDAYITTEQVKALQSRYVRQVHTLIAENTGSLTHVYFDLSIYEERFYLQNYGVGISTEDFLNHSLFSDQWFYKDSYIGVTQLSSMESQLILSHTYPILIGLTFDHEGFYIKTGPDLLYLQHLISISGFYRQATYMLAADIDMKMISKDAYQASPIGFSGTFKSLTIDPLNTLFDHQLMTGGSPSHYAILNLHLQKRTEMGYYDAYGLFAMVFGNIKDLNIIFAQVQPSVEAFFHAKEDISVGILSGKMHQSVIENVHIHGDIIISPFPSNPKYLSIGLMSGEGSGTLKRVTTSGRMEQQIQGNSLENMDQHLGGLLGKGSKLKLEDIHSTANVMSQSLDGTGVYHYMGGLMGHAQILEGKNIIYSGHLTSNQSNAYEASYIGGLFGYLNEHTESLENLLVDGLISFEDLNYKTVFLSGLLNAQGNHRKSSYKNLTFTGQISTQHDDRNMSAEDIEQSSFNLTFGLQTFDMKADIYGLFVHADGNFDLGLINKFASNIIMHESVDHHIRMSYYFGDIHFDTEHRLSKPNIYISRNTLGDHASFDSIRSEGNLNLIITKSRLEHQGGKIIITGLFERLSKGYDAKHLLNHGKMHISSFSLSPLAYDLYVSGLGYVVDDQYLRDEQGIDPKSIENNHIEGVLDHAINSADIDIFVETNGHTLVSGGVIFNGSLIKNVINTGHLSIKNEAKSHVFMEVSGIATRFTSQESKVLDSVNSGDIKSQSLTEQGFNHAAGIVVRNDLDFNHQVIQNSNRTHISKIMFSMNYGDIYAYNPIVESSATGFGVSVESRSKAGGLFTLGLISLINNMNYGNVYAPYLAGGLQGMLFLNQFSNVLPDEIFISNNINYGKIRQILSYDEPSDLFSVSQTKPQKSSVHGFGAMIGKIHTGTTTWQFAGTSNPYHIENYYFGYLLNFDQIIDMFGLAPNVSGSSAFSNAEEATYFISHMVKHMATTNPNDQSAPPFTVFEVYWWFVTRLVGAKIRYLDTTDLESGMFYEQFAFRKRMPVFRGTDQYIHDYIQYFPKSKAHPERISFLETTHALNFDGIYALSSSQGIKEGIFMPDHINLSYFHNYESDVDSSWMGDGTTQDSVLYIFKVRLRQINMNLATSIYDLTLIQGTLESGPIQGGLTLSKPLIDEERGLITYYIPSNAEILINQSLELKTVARFIEAQKGLMNVKEVPIISASNEVTYKSVGTHKKTIHGDMVEIGPYDSSGRYHLTQSGESQTYTEYGNANYQKQNAVYRSHLSPESNVLTQIFKHQPHLYTDLWIIRYWSATGVLVTPTIDLGPGQGAYKRTTIPGYVQPIYEYVGPSEILVTYVNSGMQSNVSIFSGTENQTFIPSLLPGSYQISQQASLFYEGLPVFEVASIPKSYGIYEAMYDEDGLFIDSVDLHYGSIKVFSSSYNPNEPLSYKTYQIRIIRTAPEFITSASEFWLNGLNGLPEVFDFHHIYSIVNMQYQSNLKHRTIHLTYMTYDMPHLYDLKERIILYNELDEEVHKNFYQVNNAMVNAPNVFNNLLGSFGQGLLDIEIRLADDLPKGFYTIQIELISGQVFSVTFEIDPSDQAIIEEMTYQGLKFNPIGASHTHVIPYGLYYQEDDLTSYIVNFSNILDFVNVSSEQLKTNLPSYLEGLIISPFSQINLIELHIVSLEDQRYAYQLQYELQAENGQISYFTHHLIEHEVETNIERLYMNGRYLNLDELYYKVSYQDAPTFRIEYFLNEFYLKGDHHMTMNLQTHLVLNEVVLESVDYFLSPIEGIGFEISMNPFIPQGFYHFHMEFVQEVTLWGFSFHWLVSFDEFIFEKVQNHESRLKNIQFISDEIYEGFQIIMDDRRMDEERFGMLMSNPMLRDYHVLPTVGIVYQNPVPKQAYYIIGSVQKTMIDYFMPVFHIPDHAKIVKVIDPYNIDPEVQSTHLYADFSVPTDGFHYVHYRIYAEDFDLITRPEGYTDYFIAVHDTSLNVRVSISWNNMSSQPVNHLYVDVLICKDQVFSSCPQSSDTFKMSLFSAFVEGMQSHVSFQTTSYGYYTIVPTLSQNLTYQLTIENTLIEGNTVYLTNSIIPRRYRINITIYDDNQEDKWGVIEKTGYGS